MLSGGGRSHLQRGNLMNVIIGFLLFITGAQLMSTPSPILWNTVTGIAFLTLSALFVALEFVHE